MKRIKYDKLIRDEIPGIIEAAGKKAIVEVADKDETIRLLNLKLLEEINEYNESDNIEELADLVEVVYGILYHKNISREDFEKIRREKEEKRGSFKKGLRLMEVIED